MPLESCARAVEKTVSVVNRTARTLRFGSVIIVCSRVKVCGDFAPIGAWWVFCHPTPRALAHGYTPEPLPGQERRYKTCMKAFLLSRPSFRHPRLGQGRISCWCTVANSRSVEKTTCVRVTFRRATAGPPMTEFARPTLQMDESCGRMLQNSISAVDSDCIDQIDWEGSSRTGLRLRIRPKWDQTISERYRRAARNLRATSAQ